MTQKRAIITGAASGIGAAVVRKLAQPGAALTLHTRRSVERLRTVAKQARSAGAEVEIALGDLAEPGIANSIVDTHQSRFGALDNLIANAGFPLLMPFQDMKQDDIAYAFRGNTQSFFELTQAALPMLRASEAGRIVGLGSFTSHVFRTDMPQFPASAAAKGAIEVAVRSMSLALGSEGITVNCVVPGYIAKDEGTSDALDEDTLNAMIAKIPMGRVGQPDDVARMVCFLLTPECGYVTGQVIHVNGGICA